MCVAVSSSEISPQKVAAPKISKIETYLLIDWYRFYRKDSSISELPKTDKKRNSWPKMKPKLTKTSIYSLDKHFCTEANDFDGRSKTIGIHIIHMVRPQFYAAKSGYSLNPSHVHNEKQHSHTIVTVFVEFRVRTRWSTLKSVFTCFLITKLYVQCLFSLALFWMICQLANVIHLPNDIDTQLEEETSKTVTNSIEYFAISHFSHISFHIHKINR